MRPRSENANAFDNGSSAATSMTVVELRGENLQT